MKKIIFMLFALSVSSFTQTYENSTKYTSSTIDINMTARVGGSSTQLEITDEYGNPILGGITFLHDGLTATTNNPDIVKIRLKAKNGNGYLNENLTAGFNYQGNGIAPSTSLPISATDFGATGTQIQSTLGTTVTGGLIEVSSSLTTVGAEEKVYSLLSPKKLTVVYTK